MPEIEFWYEFASTYSYPAAMRIEKAASTKGVAVRWRPFLLAPIFGAQGWNDSPFNIYPAKGKNMWRDLERICSDLDIPLKQPPFRFPQNGLKAARIALAHEEEPWMPAFTRAVYTRISASRRTFPTTRRWRAFSRSSVSTKHARTQPPTRRRTSSG